MNAGRGVVQCWTSPDGRATASILRSITGYFLFVEEARVDESGGGVVPPYHYWKETMRSGLYETEAAAQSEAFAAIAWLRCPGPG